MSLTSSAVRAHLVRALEAELVGPYGEREELDRATSANFTGRAQRTNVELGVLIRDEAFASRVSGQWRALVTNGLFRRHAGP